MTLEITKVPTGIGGFDELSLGGLPAGRSTLVAGSAGSGKTLFAFSFLAEGIKRFDEPGVFVTFEEPPRDIRLNMASLGYPDVAAEASPKWAFVDASPLAYGEGTVIGEYDLGPLVTRIQRAVRAVGAKRVSLDSIDALFGRFADSGRVRLELFRLTATLKEMGVTSMLTMERSEDGREISRFGVEEFVVDNVVVLRNLSEEEKRRRTVEILKLRGAPHRTGEWLFTIVDGEGLVVIPISSMALRHRAAGERVTTGNEELDRMCCGGFYRDSLVIVSGPTGAGKTLSAVQFVVAGAAVGERCLLVTFEESREGLTRDASGWGFDIGAMERSGTLELLCEYPEMASLEDHFIAIKRAIDVYQPSRLAIDNLSALERVATPRGLRDFILGMASFLKQQEITSLLTSTATNLFGAPSTTESHVSTLADCIVVLRYVELSGQVRRAVGVLKMRGSGHDRELREFTIGDGGMRIGEGFQGVAGILAGQFATSPLG